MNKKEKKKAPAKVTKVLHPLSRKAKKLTLEGIRDIKKEKNATIRKKEQKPIKQLLDHLQEIIKKENKKTFTEYEISEIIDQYLLNKAPEEESKQITSRTNKSEYSKTLYNDEIKDFKTNGYALPDLTNSNYVKFLINWDGDMKYITQQTLPLKRFKYIEPKNEMETESESK
ncbi:hypothetical protein RB653_006467 [Dictyostelium firmibasis]|uniref:Translation machinery-associated protein 16 n=1 Tax=Dictyostelium firmibasis TaxID=79012 RepID=A0AAN7U2S4_9MYCE